MNTHFLHRRSYGKVALEQSNFIGLVNLFHKLMSNSLNHNSFVFFL